MKRYLLLFTIMAAGVLAGQSQTVLNEVYSDPGSGKSEFIELYNSAAVGAQNVNCFTILTYWSDGTNKGWYVLDLPNHTIDPKGYYVLAAASPFNVQGTTGAIANVNWNDIAFRSGSDGGYLKKYQVSGSTYTDLNLSNATIVSDLMVNGDFAAGQNTLTLVFQNGQFINGFWGGGPTGTLPITIDNMPDLNDIPLIGSCGITEFDIDFSEDVLAVEFKNQAGGSDNGYARSSDGKCGAWVKTSAQVNHTPGITNGSAAGLDGELITSQFIICNTNPAGGPSTVEFNITGISGSATLEDDFPVEVRLYLDKGTVGVFDGPDEYVSSKFETAINDGSQTFSIPQTSPVILVYKTKRGCFDKIVDIDMGCSPLPVKFSSFTAARNKNNVAIKWETSTEINNRGFYIQRNINGSWDNIAFVFSQADNGNSNSVLSYSYNDLNTTKGVTQYRIQQVDLDGKARYSEIRSVRGEANISKLLVYPNPTTSGNVNVVFEDQSPKNVTVLDMSGRMIKQYRNVINNVSVDNLENGIYSIQVTDVSTATISVEKVVVKKR